MNVLDSVGATVAVEKPLTPGRTAAATSRPVALSTEDLAAVNQLHADLVAPTPAGTNVIGHVIVDTVPTHAVTQVITAAANGETSSRVNAAASTNATSLKVSAGQVGEIDVFNSAAYAVFLKFYNKASAPTVGTDTPVWTIPIAAGGGFSKSFPRGKSFSTGIAYAITKLQADSDTTVVVAGDLTGSIDWI